MKKILILTLCLIMLTGCGANNEYTVELSEGDAVVTLDKREDDGVSGTIKIESNTAKDDCEIYEFEYVNDVYRITYPNGVLFAREKETAYKPKQEFVSGDISGYHRSDDLIYIINNRPGADNGKPQNNPGAFFSGFCMVIVGLFNTLAPETVWYMSIGWRIKDSKPTEEAIKFNRFSGIAVAVIGFIMVFTS